MIDRFWIAGLVALATAVAATGEDATDHDLSRPLAAGNAPPIPMYVQYASSRAMSVEAELLALGGRIDHRFPRINAVSVSIPEVAADRLSSLPHVLFHEPVPEHRTTAQVVPFNIDQLQARDIWDADRDGQIDSGAADGSGVKICIIDTGLYVDHDEFTGMTVSGESQIIGESWTEDGRGHGTHVAGTLNAVNDDSGVVGVMPGGAEFHIVKIFANDGLWKVGQSNLGQAAIACRDSGANLISMSLSGAPSVIEEAIFQDLYDQFNIISVASAGNDGNGIPSYPASYESVISVAAVDRNEVVAGFSQYPDTDYDPLIPPLNTEWDMVELSGGGVDVLSTWPGPPHRQVPANQVTINGVTHTGSHIDESGLATILAPLVSGGRCGPGSGSIDWEGALVLCQRGEVGFSEKINEVGSNGGLGTVIYNDAAGEFNGTCDGGCTSTIPAIGISQAAGEALLGEIGNVAELVADNGSGCQDCSGGYQVISGTSMATPGVAAGLAIIWDSCGGPSGISNQQLRQLLRDSARDLQGTHGATGVGGSAFTYGAGWDPATGWGLVQLADARQLGNTRFGSVCSLDMGLSPNTLDVCTLSSDSASVMATLDESFLGSTTFSVSGLPAGTTGDFSPNPLIHPANDSVLTLNELSGAAGGSYAINLTATDDNDPNNRVDGVVALNLVANLPGAPSLQAPEINSTGLDVRPTLSWNPASDAGEYRLEVADDPGFGTILYSAMVAGNSHTVTTTLNTSTLYYWRVTAINLCGQGMTSPIASFETMVMECQAPQSQIPDNDVGGVSDVMSLNRSNSINDLEVALQVTHSWVGDLTISLTHVDSGTSLTLIDRPGRDATGSGCRNDDIDVTLDDEGTAPVEEACSPSPPAITGTLTPDAALSSFDGEALAGDWLLTVTDSGANDSGTLESWCLLPTLDALNNTDPVAVDNSFSTDEDVMFAGNVSSNDLDNDGDVLGYSVLSEPENGVLAMAADGSFNYWPRLDFNGSDPFTYQVNDGNGGVSSATVFMTVEPVNDVPTATDDGYTLIHDQMLSVPAPGILANDDDVEGTSISAILEATVSNGTLTLNADGSFDYSPDPGFTGVDQFSYFADDGSDPSVTPAIVTLNVQADLLWNNGFEG